MKILLIFVISEVSVLCFMVNSVHAGMFLGPALQACVVYYDEHQAIINVPGEYDDEGPCSIQSAFTAINAFVANGYKLKNPFPDGPDGEGSLPYFTTQVVMVKP